MNLCIVNQQKKRRKSFDELGARMQKVRTDSLLSDINDFIKRECPEISITQLLAYLIHPMNMQSDKTVARIGYEMFTESMNLNLFF